jgi:RNA polymerase sigma factor (sigma-70 family)
MDMETAVRELAPQLLRYTLGRTRDAGLAEEASQEALVALVSRWRRHGPPDSPAAFTFAIARRRATRALLRRRLFSPLESILDGGPAGPASEADSRIDLRRTLAALGRLPRRDRHVLLIAASGELRLGEAARRAGYSPSTFRMRLLRARQRLRELLEAKK